MGNTIDTKQFVKLFENQHINLQKLDRGTEALEVAEKVNRDPDTTLRRKDELQDLFEVIDSRFDTDGVSGQLTLRTEDGQLTQAGRMVEMYRRAAESKQDFFDRDMHYVHITNWPHDRMSPESLRDKVHSPHATLRIYNTDPASNLHCPPPEADGVMFATNGSFNVRTSGNFTSSTPKPSYKISLTDKADGIAGMSKLNLKSMWNDVSQMRESLAWDLFREAGVHAPRHTYAKVAINDRYSGLYSVIEQVDKPFLTEHFGRNDRGNLYKAYWSDLGPADLSYRKDDSGDDSGRQYFVSDNIDHRTYQLQTNTKDSSSNNYDDIAKFIRVINGVGLEDGEAKFNSPEYKKAVEEVFDAKGFLRWAATNMLLGAWDNYYATPSNFYLYNSGKKGGEDEFVDKPYFHWIPWDYDNSFGSDFFDTKWQYADIVDWEKNTRNYHGGHKQSHLPLITNLLKNDEFKQYYLDFMEHTLDTNFNPQVISGKIGTEGSGGIWDRVRNAAYLESDSANGSPHTGRQWTNEEIYHHGSQHHELHRHNTRLEGIEHYVRMRHDSARSQLTKLRTQYPKGASGADFNASPDPIPK